ncbi:MAG: hypothetical protein EPO08_13915 [Rhodospirillaceae bacterium]|nr:MAG: hypothetical protein EPO08_13915 [Rhodospirillaceae bacterium]
MADVLFYPPFPGRPQLFDQLYRSLWNFLPALSRIDRLIFPYAGDDFALLDAEQSLHMAAAYMSRDFDPAIANYAPRYAGKVAFVADDGLDPARYTAPLKGIIVWSTQNPAAVAAARAIAARTGAEVVHADPMTVQQETLEVIAFVYKMFAADELSRMLADSANVFYRRMAVLENRPMSVFGNGPSLGAVVEQRRDPGPTVRAVCNSTIGDEAALAHLKPEILFCGDPIQHCGCSLYAGRFRADLAMAMADPARLLITQLGYLPYFKEVIPAVAHDRIVGIGLDRRRTFNVDLKQEFVVAATANVFTMLVLPVAFTLSRAVDIYGCDGMPFAQASKPWSHANEGDYMNKMAVTHRLHPGFWRRNYEEEFASYCQDMEDILSVAEKKGCTVRSRTPSYVPALAKRYVEQ